MAAAAQVFRKPSAADDRALRTEVDNVPATGLPTACDSSSEAATRAQLRMWGRDQKSFPAVYRTLERLKKANWQFANMTETGKPVRYGMSHAPDDYAMIHVTGTNGFFADVAAMSFSSMYVVDSDTDKYEIQTINVYTKNAQGLADKLIASATADNLDNDMRDMPLVAQSLVSGNNNPDLADVIAITKFIGEAGAQDFCWNVRMDRGAQSSVTGVNISDPTPAKGHQPPASGTDRTIICLNRGATNTDGDFCDYGPTQPGTENQNLNLLFPFAGSLTTLNPIYTMNLDGHIIPASPQGTGAQPGTLRIRLVKKEGGSCTAPFTLDAPWKGFNVVNGNRVVWQFADSHGDRTNSSQYLNAGNIGTCAQLDPGDVQNWYMMATFFETKNGLPFKPVSIGIGSLSSFAGYDANKQLPAVGYQWGCVIEGTAIVLADGRTVPIESLKTGDMLMGPSGKPLRVTGVSPGNDRKFIKLVDEAGGAVEVTLDHPVLTDKGMRRARDLRAGDKVYGRNGPSVLREVHADDRKEPARVYSVHLADANGNDIKEINDRAFYAGQILVGDYAAQHAVMEQAAADRMHGKK
jgi:hypothetical protein